MQQCKGGRRRLVVWLMVWAMIGAAGAPYIQAQPNKPSQPAAERSEGKGLLKEGLSLYDELEWDEAIERLKAALARGLDADARAEAYWHLTVIARANDDFKAAEDYLVEVLRARPDFAMPETLTGTDFEPLFKAALRRTDRQPPRVRILPFTEIKRDSPIRVTAQVADDSQITRVDLAYQSPDAGAETVVGMKNGGDGRWSGEIPGTATHEPGEVSIRVSAQDDWRNIGTQPGTAIIPKGGGKGIFYLIGGAIVAVGGGVAALLFGGGGSGGDDTSTDDGPEAIPAAWPQSAAPSPPN